MPSVFASPPESVGRRSTVRLPSLPRLGERASGAFDFATSLTFVLLAMALLAMQCLIGGAKLVYGLPTYTLLGIAGLAAVGISPRRSSGKLITTCLITAVSMTGYVIWRSSTSPVEYLARPDFYMVIAAILAYGLGAIHFSGSRTRMWIVWVILALATLHVAVGVVQFKESHNFMLLPWVFRPDYSYRASGFYICPNHLAGLLEIAGLLALSISVWGRVKPWQRITAGYFFATALLGLAITGSRGGYLSMIGGLLVFVGLSLWAVRYVKRKWFWMMLLVSFVGLAGLVGTAVAFMSKSSDLEHRLGQIYDPTNMRVHMWRAALKAHELEPWLGVGSGTYLYYGRRFRDPSVQNDPQHVHSDYLELLAEYGIVGCGLMGLFLLAHFTAGFSAIRDLFLVRLRPARLTRSNELALLIGAVSALGAIAFHSVIDFNLHIPANVVICAFLFGMLANPRSAAPEEQLRWRIHSDHIRFFVPAVSIVLIALAAPRIVGEYYGERARMAIRDQANESGIRYATLAIAKDPKNPRLYYYLGEGRHNLAMLEKSPAARFNLHTEAARAFVEGLKIFPADLQLLLKLGRTLDNIQRYPEADLVFRQALAADPNFGNVYAYYGYHFFLQRRLLRAEKLYRKAVELQEAEVAPLGLKDIAQYRERATHEETADLYPIEDEESDLLWEPGEP